FAAAQWGGELIGQQMGLNLGEIFDPQSGHRTSTIGELYFLLATVVFLGINGHHTMLIGVHNSLQSVPVGSAGMSRGVLKTIVAMFQSSTILAIRLAGPMLVTML